MGKIGDLFVRLGLKSEDFKKGMTEAKGEVKGFGAESAAMSKMAVGAWAAVGAAVVKFAKDAVSLTQTWGDRWRETMEGVRGAYGQFVRQLSSGDGWRDLFQNMADAYNKSKEIARALDEIFERKISLSYDEAETEKRKSELELIMRDQSKSNAERKAAAQEIIRLEQELGNTKKAVYQQEAQAMRDKFKLATNLNDEQIDFVVKEYNANRDVIKQSREWYEERTALAKKVANLDKLRGGDQTGRVQESWKEARAELEAFDASADSTLVTISKWLAGYDKANDELVKGMADAEVAVIGVDTEINRASMRATALLGSLDKVKTPKVTPATEDKTKPVIDTEWLEVQADAVEQAYAAAADAAYDEMDAANLAAFEAQHGLTDAVDSTTKALREMGEASVVAAEQAEANFEKMKAAAQEVGEAISAGLVDAMQEFTDQLFGLSEGNAGAVFQALLTPLADLSVKMGEMIMAQGIAVEAAKQGLKDFSGVGQIAAGAALVAIGAAARSGLAALAKGGGATAATSTSTAASSTTAAAGVSTQELHIVVEGKLRGQDIVLAGQQAQRAWNR